MTSLLSRINWEAAFWIAVSLWVCYFVLFARYKRIGRWMDRRRERAIESAEGDNPFGEYDWPTPSERYREQVREEAAGIHYWMPQETEQA